MPARIVSLEKWERNYALSTVRGTFNTYDYWNRKGYSDAHAMDNAIKYAIGQALASSNFENLPKLAGDLEALGNIANALGGVLRAVHEKWRKEQLNQTLILRHIT